MRVFKILLVGVAGAVAALLASQRKRTIRTILTTLEDDPDDATLRTLDPTELYDPLPTDADLDKKIGQDLDPDVGEFRIGEFDVDAKAMDLLFEDADPLELIAERALVDPPTKAALDRMPRAARGTNELYGLVTPRAVDHDLAAEEAHDGYRHADEGEHYYEALLVSAAEFGAEPEHDLNVIDHSDPHTPARNEHPDEPVADKGSGGPAGL